MDAGAGHRPLEEIQDDIRFIRSRLAELKAERFAAIRASHGQIYLPVHSNLRLRNQWTAIIDDFDEGMDYQPIADKHQLPYATVTSILNRHGRAISERTIETIKKLPPLQRAEYDRLRRGRTSRATALRIALSMPASPSTKTKDKKNGQQGISGPQPQGLREQGRRAAVAS